MMPLCEPTVLAGAVDETGDEVASPHKRAWDAHAATTGKVPARSFRQAQPIGSGSESADSASGALVAQGYKVVSRQAITESVTRSKPSGLVRRNAQELREESKHQ